MLLPIALEEFADQKVWTNFTAKKVPIDPNSRYAGQSTNPEKWSDFQTAERNIGETGHYYDNNMPVTDTIVGVGIALGDESGLCGIDLDHVIENGRLTTEAEEIVATMDSYTEISPSGTGIHILFKGKIKDVISRKKVKRTDYIHYEIYAGGRFFTVTGNEYGRHDQIEDRTEQTRAVYEKFYVPYIKNENRKKMGKKEGMPRVCNDGISAMNPMIEAIRDRNPEYLQELLQCEPVTISKGQFFRYIYRFNLGTFLGVPASSSFSCILPGHHDTHASASIFKDNVEEAGYWHYKCHADCIGDGTCLNIRDIVSIIGGYEKDYDVFEFLKKALNISLSTDDKVDTVKIQIEKMLEMIEADEEENLLRKNCPQTYKNIRYALETYMAILNLTLDCISASTLTKDGRVLMYMSTKQVAVLCRSGSIDKVHKRIKTLCYHHLIDVVPDNEIPNTRLHMAVEGRSDPTHRHIGFYYVRVWINGKDYDAIEDAGIRWKKNGYTLKAVSYELFLRTEGPDVASALYPQYAKIHSADGSVVQRPVSGESEIDHEIISNYILSSIEDKGYVKEADISSTLHIKKAFVKRLIKDICNCYHLKRGYVNSCLKEKYNISCNGYPVIIYKDKN